MRTKILLLFVMILGVCYVIGQSPNSFNPTFQNIVPASPEATSLTKFGDYPVSLASGVPKISIPLFSYSSAAADLNLSISLDYFAGGIKVDEEPSVVGIGWALNAGGVISRNVRGLPDELPTIGFIHEAKLPQETTEGNRPGNNEQSRPFNKINAKNLDNATDQFSFNFAGRSGRFLLGKNNDMLILDQQKLKISVKLSKSSDIPLLNDSVITAITIVDEQGVIYQFNDLEVTTDKSSYSPGKTSPSAWYLSRMISHNLKDTVSFSYEQTSYGYDAGLYYQTTMPIEVSGGVDKFESHSSSSSPLGIQGKRLKKILLPSGVQVDFQYSSSQLVDPDFGASSNHFALQKITIHDKNASRGYRFIHDYSVNRLTLKKIIPIRSATEIPDSSYQFGYYDALPDRLSHAQDHWGYYNNNIGNTMYPDEYVSLPGYEAPHGGTYRHFVGANRDTDPTKVKAGALNKIIYPSGGYTIFNFEANQAKDNWLDQEIQYTQYFVDTSELNIPVNVTSGDIFPRDSSYFTYTGETPDLNFKINIRWGTYEGDGGRIVAELYEQGKVKGAPIGQFIVPYPQQQDVSKSFVAHNLQKGKTYTIVMYSQNMRNWSSVVDFTIQEVVKDTSLFHYAHKQPYVGGLRIKTISNFDGVSTKPSSIKTFSYLLDDNSTTSGTLGTYPRYSYTASYDYNRSYGVVVPNLEPYNLGQVDDYVVRTTSSVNEIAYSNGSPVIYQRVIERDSAGGKYNGQTVTYYTSYKEGHQPAIIQVFPLVPPINATWLYGLLTKKMVYDANNKLQEVTENSYDYPADPYWSDPVRIENFRSISIAPVKFKDQIDHGVLSPPRIDPNDYPVYFLMSSYSPQAGRSELKKSTTTMYTSSGGTLTTEHSYSYDPDYYYIKNDTAVDSRNRKEIIRSYYPADAVAANHDQNGVYQGMLGKNIINTVISSTKRSVTALIDSVSTVYKVTGTSYRPSEIWKTNLLNHNEKLLQFNKYDADGNILERQKTNDTKEVFLWGYTGQFPVAKIVGSDYTTVSGFIDQHILDNATNYDDTKVQTELNKIRSGLNKSIAQVTTYTYSPLFGVTSETDPKGNTVYYEYDGFGKLKNIKDYQGKVIKSFQYNYRGTNN